MKVDCRLELNPSFIILEMINYLSIHQIIYILPHMDPKMIANIVRENTVSHKIVEHRILKPRNISVQLYEKILLFALDSLHLNKRIEKKRPKPCVKIIRKRIYKDCNLSIFWFIQKSLR